jgi:hypothetical protein
LEQVKQHSKLADGGESLDALTSAAHAVIKANNRRKEAAGLRRKYGESPDVVIELSAACQDCDEALEQLAVMLQLRKHYASCQTPDIGGHPRLP